jgi:hypothetical protein
VLFGALIVLGSLTAAAGVIFATSQAAPAVQPPPCDGDGVDKTHISGDQ